MTLLRRTLLAAVIAVGMTAAAAVPAGAGLIHTVSVSGTATCNTATGEYALTWTITKTNQQSSSTNVSNATQTPPGTNFSTSVTPNPIPGDPNAFQSSTLATTLPGNTSGPVTLNVTVPLSTAIGTLTLDGTCVVAVAAALPAGPDFTG